MTPRNSRPARLASRSIGLAPGGSARPRHGGARPAPGRPGIAIDGALTRRAP